LGHPCKFQWVSRLGSVTAWHSSTGRKPNLAALNRGRHLYSAGWPSRWALAHISSSFYLFTFATNVWHWKFVTADITAVFVNNQHGIQQRGQDFDKKFVFEGVHSKVDRRIS